MSRIGLVGLLLIGLAACTSGPKRQSAARSSSSSRESTAATPSNTKPAARSTTARQTPTAKQPVRRTAAHPDTVTNAVNPLTNH
jgi:hypothetical protein